jgi:NAD(P)-dependent dehydrogenase (short-subunit alcohol dehydrogenase family)|tara:strand:- start:1313 stop:2167 length:855 start_codon:yes stop_codon:yes gene_type:complete
MNKSVVITGVSTGIGYQLCADLISKGYLVFGSVRKSEDGQRLSDKFGATFIPLYFDITDHAAIEKAALVVEKRLKGATLTGLFNNAGLAVAGPLLHLSVNDLRYQFEVNVIGLIKVSQVFSGLLGTNNQRQGMPGRIVMISSINGKIAMPFIGAYCGSKFALEGLSQSLRTELNIYGIKLIVVGPGPIKTPIFDKTILKATEEFSDTPYEKAMNAFLNKFVLKTINKAMTPEVLSERIIKIFESATPKSNYIITKYHFFNYTLPNLLSVGFLNAFFIRTLGLKR